jgi:hypothetical protein
MRASDDSGILANGATPSFDEPADTIRTVIAAVRDRLPTNWSLVSADFEVPADPQVDAELRLCDSDGNEAVVLVEAKRLLNTRDVLMALEQLERSARRFESSTRVLPVLAARYLPPPTRERIAASGAGYADATGNLLLRSERPALFLRDRGADSDPWRPRGRPRGSLNGPPAASVVRALVDFAPPYSVPELSGRAGTSTGATYRVVELLAEEGLLERERYGPIGTVDWRAILERWSNDYGFERSNRVQTFLEPRGLEALTARLADTTDIDYVVTGSLAAARAAAYAPARLATIYVKDTAAAAEAWQLRPTQTGANIALAVGDYAVVFERTDTLDGVRMAALSQTAVDLLTGPGRNPSEATALLDWMTANESSWRR